MGEADPPRVDQLGERAHTSRSVRTGGWCGACGPRPRCASISSTSSCAMRRPISAGSVHSRSGTRRSGWSTSSSAGTAHQRCRSRCGTGHGHLGSFGANSGRAVSELGQPLLLRVDHLVGHGPDLVQAQQRAREPVERHRACRRAPSTAAEGLDDAGLVARSRRGRPRRRPPGGRPRRSAARRSGRQGRHLDAAAVGQVRDQAGVRYVAVDHAGVSVTTESTILRGVLLAGRKLAGGELLGELLSCASLLPRVISR